MKMKMKMKVKVKMKVKMKIKMKKRWQGFGEIGAFLYCRRDRKMVQPLQTTFRQGYRKLAESHVTQGSHSYAHAREKMEKCSLENEHVRGSIVRNSQKVKK